MRESKWVAGGKETLLTAVPGVRTEAIYEEPFSVVMRWKEGEGTSEYLKPSGYTGAKPRGGAHRVDHRPDVRPGSRANVLKIEHERVKSAQNAVRRSHRLLPIRYRALKSSEDSPQAHSTLARKS